MEKWLKKSEAETMKASSDGHLEVCFLPAYCPARPQVTGTIQITDLFFSQVSSSFPGSSFPVWVNEGYISSLKDKLHRAGAEELIFSGASQGREQWPARGGSAINIYGRDA